MNSIKKIPSHLIHLFWNRNKPAPQLTIVRRETFRCLFILAFLIGLTFIHDRVHVFESSLVHTLVNVIFIMIWIIAFVHIALTSIELESLKEVKKEK